MTDKKTNVRISNLMQVIMDVPEFWDMPESKESIFENYIEINFGKEKFPFVEVHRDSEIVKRYDLRYRKK